MDIFEPGYSYRDSDLAKAAGFYPFFPVLSSSEGPVVTVDGRQVIMLGSNNYLGLTHHPEVLKAAHDALDKYGTSCTGSRFLNGNLDLHETLERELAEFTGKQAAVVFSSGFLANLGAIGQIGSTEDAVIFSASENHASLYDGARMARSRRVRLFDDADDLGRQLARRASWPQALVVTDGVFSMTGREADLRRIVALKKKFGFRIYVDDAHGIGVLGPQGRGTAASQGVASEIDLLFGTFSKSLASIGGFVAGERPIIEYLRHNVRTLIFSAALPPASAAAALAALRVMQREQALFDRLWENAVYFRTAVERIGYRTMGTTTPIIPLFIGSEAVAMRMCCEALQMGLFATPAVYPAVPKGHALIRTSVTPAHTREHLDGAVDVLTKLAEKYPVYKDDPSLVPVAREMDIEREIRRWLASQAIQKAHATATQPPI
jgi:8-amino-7-oxononanoate synthase